MGCVFVSLLIGFFKPYPFSIRVKSFSSLILTRLLAFLVSNNKNSIHEYIWISAVIPSFFHVSPSASYRIPR